MLKTFVNLPVTFDERVTSSYRRVSGQHFESACFPCTIHTK